MDRDAQLLQAWRDGDASAGERLFDRHFVALSRFFRNKVRDGVDDLIQATFLGLMETRDRYRGQGSFRSYVFGVAFNVLRNHYRDARRDADRIDPAVTSMFDLAPGASSVIAARDEQRLLLEALRHIPLEHQALLELYFWEPLTAPEIATALGLPEGTVRTRIRRGKGLLREEMERLSENRSLIESTLSNLDDWARSVKDLAGVA